MKYLASDGAVFDTEKECKRHEANNSVAATYAFDYTQIVFIDWQYNHRHANTETEFYELCHEMFYDDWEAPVNHLRMIVINTYIPVGVQYYWREMNPYPIGENHILEDFLCTGPNEGHYVVFCVDGELCFMPIETQLAPLINNSAINWQLIDRKEEKNNE